MHYCNTNNKWLWIFLRTGETEFRIYSRWNQQSIINEFWLEIISSPSHFRIQKTLIWSRLKIHLNTNYCQYQWTARTSFEPQINHFHNSTLDDGWFSCKKRIPNVTQCVFTISEAHKKRNQGLNFLINLATSIFWIICEALFLLPSQFSKSYSAKKIVIRCLRLAVQILLCRPFAERWKRWTSLSLYTDRPVGETFLRFHFEPLVFIYLVVLFPLSSCGKVSFKILLVSIPPRKC